MKNRTHVSNSENPENSENSDQILKILIKLPFSTLEVFLKAAQKRPFAGRIGINCLKKVSSAQIQKIFAKIPATEMTPLASEFALLALNRQRLLTGLDN